MDFEGIRRMHKAELEAKDTLIEALECKVAQRKQFLEHRGLRIDTIKSEIDGTYERILEIRSKTYKYKKEVKRAQKQLDIMQVRLNSLQQELMEISYM